MIVTILQPTRNRFASPRSPYWPGRTTSNTGSVVIAYWSPYCGPALEALPGITRLSEELKTYDATLFLVTSEARDGHVAETLEDRASALVTYYDESRALTRALEQFGTPAYYVVGSAAAEPGGGKTPDYYTLHAQVVGLDVGRESVGTERGG